MNDKGRIWFNGQLRESAECMVHVASHALHYGSSVFEGIRAYETPKGTFIFRGKDHIDRLIYSAAVYRIPVPYGFEELQEACRETVRDSGLASAYIRPLISRGNCGLGVIPKDMNVVDVSIMVSPWGAYLGEDGLKNGIKACISEVTFPEVREVDPGSQAHTSLAPSLRHTRSREHEYTTVHLVEERERTPERIIRQLVPVGHVMRTCLQTLTEHA